MKPLLTRTEIIRAVRIRKLLEQADAETGATAENYRAKALDLARGYSRGTAIRYDGKLLLGDDG